MGTFTLLDAVEIVGTVVAACSTVAGMLYWLARRWADLATEEYVDRHVAAELSSVETNVETALERTRENRTELEDLRALVEGSNEAFEGGMTHYLQETVERTAEIEADLAEVRRTVSELERERDE